MEVYLGYNETTRTRVPRGGNRGSFGSVSGEAGTVLFSCVSLGVSGKNRRFFSCLSQGSPNVVQNKKYHFGGQKLRQQGAFCQGGASFVQPSGESTEVLVSVSESPSSGLAQKSQRLVCHRKMVVPEKIKSCLLVFLCPICVPSEGYPRGLTSPESTLHHH